MQRNLLTPSHFTAVVFAPLLVVTLWVGNLAHPMSVKAVTQEEVQQTIGTQLHHDLWTAFTNTGDDTSVLSTTENQNTTDISTQNTAEVQQVTEATANTGYNQANRNISIGGNAGLIVTGDALISTTGMVDANRTLVGSAPLGSDSQLSTTSEITNTGDDASFTSQAETDQMLLVRGANNALISQATNAVATTGHNVADRNISIGGVAGFIQTGQAGIQTNYLVAANNTVALVGGESGEGGTGPGSGASIVVANTGRHSEFDLSSNLNQQTSITNQNTAAINQGCSFCSVVTGYNESSRGISRGGDAGVIETAPAVIDLNFLAGANSNATTLGGQTHNPYRALALDVLNTGDWTDVTTESSTTQNTSVDLNNSANVNQSATVLADTGHNVADRNISIGGDAGVIITGDAIIDILMNVVVNQSQLQ